MNQERKSPRAELFVLLDDGTEFVKQLTRDGHSFALVTRLVQEHGITRPLSDNEFVWYPASRVVRLRMVREDSAA